MLPPPGGQILHKCPGDYEHLPPSWSDVHTTMSSVTYLIMAARLTRLFCSHTVLLSILSILGILELGRNIFGNKDTSADYNVQTVNTDVQVTTLKLPEFIKNTPKYKVTTSKIETEKSVVLPKKKKYKKYIRQKILLLAYARLYPKKSFNHLITTFLH